MTAEVAERRRSEKDLLGMTCLRSRLVGRRIAGSGDAGDWLRVSIYYIGLHAEGLGIFPQAQAAGFSVQRPLGGDAELQVVASIGPEVAALLQTSPVQCAGQRQPPDMKGLVGG